MKLSRRVLIALGIAGTALLLLVGVGVYGLVVGPPDTTTLITANASPAPATVTPSATTAPIPETGSAREFARAVAATLFDWDTMSRTGRDEIIDQLLAVADPSGYETNGLYSDLQGYLPTNEQWQQLREYETRQGLDINTLTVPDEWDDIVADPANELAEGTMAITVDGTRVREGSWHGQDSTKTTTVAFTMFLACPPATESCALLRLSMLGNPLR
ncbi:hypothetical protein [Microbacterium sp. NPDC056234]|uniref:hypothetical protein n=1 Tax=Microbacterium sp. NPDC056234 TaxID=3345757 RepID=UPI0035D8967F